MRLEMTAGTYTMPSATTFDSSFTVTEVAFVASGGIVRIELDASAVQPLFRVAPGAPDTRFSSVTLAGQIVVDDANTMHTFTSCAFVASSVAHPAGGGALSVNRGRVLVEQSTFTGVQATRGGAMALTGATRVIVTQSTFTSNAATKGGAVHVDGPSVRLTLQASTFAQNDATDSGGAIHVERGIVILSDITQLAASNTAGSGTSYHLAPSNEAEMVYALPAPPAHWIANAFECKIYRRPCPESSIGCPLPERQQPCDLSKYQELEGATIAMLGRGAFDSAFPFECGAGLLGSSNVTDQQGPGCRSLCPAGSYCPRASITATRCPSGSFCAEGSPLPTLCPAGTYRETAGGTAESDCVDCPAGSACVAGSSTPTHCSPGTITASTGRSSCTDCFAGTFQDATNATSCKPCADVDVCSIGQYRTGCAAISAGSCTACTAQADRYFVSHGGLSDSCATNTCADLEPCATGSYRTGCEANSRGFCTPCSSASLTRFPRQ